MTKDVFTQVFPDALFPTAARAALLKHRGSITKAAKELGVDSQLLRIAIKARPSILAAAVEAQEMALDQAETIILEALDSPEPGRRLAAANYLIRSSPAARRRGYL
jgi:transposase-like protein